MPRPSNTEQRCRQIVQGMVTVMATRGYDGATTKAIAEAAGLASGLVHYHFKNKQAILLAAIEELEHRLDARYQAFLARKTNSPAGPLLAFIDARLAPGEGADPNAVAAWVIIGAEAVRQPAIKAAYQASLQRQQATLIACIKAVVGKRPSPKQIKELAALTMAAVEGTFQLSVSAREIMPKGYAARTLVALLEAYLGPLDA